MTDTKGSSSAELGIGGAVAAAGSSEHQRLRDDVDRRSDVWESPS